MTFRSAKFLFLLVAVISAGCVSSSLKLSDGTLILKTEADPEEIFTGETTNLYVDIENNDVVPLKGVSVNIFETGLLEIVDPVNPDMPENNAKCGKTLQLLLPNKSDTLRCTLRAGKEIIGDSAKSELHVQAIFSKDFSVVQPVEFMSLEWYERQKLLGLKTKPRKYTYSDKNIEADIEFSDEMPLVLRDKKYYMYITVRNIGRGTLTQIEGPSIRYSDQTEFGSGIAQGCVFEKVYYAIGRTFPRIACELEPPVTESMKTVDLIIRLGYNYDIRDSTTVTVRA